MLENNKKRDRWDSEDTSKSDGLDLLDETIKQRISEYNDLIYVQLDEDDGAYYEAEVSAAKKKIIDKQGSVNLERNNIRNRAVKESRDVVSAARNRAESSAEATETLADDVWVSNGGFDKEIKYQQIDPAISITDDNFEEEFGQFEF